VRSTFDIYVFISVWNKLFSHPRGGQRVLVRIKNVSVSRLFFFFKGKGDMEGFELLLDGSETKQTHHNLIHGALQMNHD
jgi:hypothetical protein